ncbi:MAG: hypothetical protein JWR26_4266 [Pedosphaera sp.]|nr:hypothetical protein [Pedosphaera sp.]
MISIIGFQTSVFAQGSLIPPGAPAPTMITLSQIQPRTPITNSGAVTISASGAYYLTTNISVSSGTAVTITANNVTLDLNGFTISSTETPATGSSGILLGGTGVGRTNIFFSNGFISSSGITNNGTTTYGGNGFAYGIYSPASLVNVHVSNVSISGCLTFGIYLSNTGTLVESCTVNNVGNTGINADVITDSLATGCGQTGISANTTASNCRGNSYASTAVISGATAQNCYGISTAGFGVLANNVQNCSGTSTSNTGVFAGYNALNCSGTSTSGTGLIAANAQNCYGSSSSATASMAGISAAVANNCYGNNNGAGSGINTTLANNCYGYANTGTGIIAHTGNSCFGTATSGTAVNFTKVYNGQ